MSQMYAGQKPDLSQEKHEKLMPCSRRTEIQEPLHKQKWYNFA